MAEYTSIKVPGVDTINTKARLIGFTGPDPERGKFHFPMGALFSPDNIAALGIVPTVVTTSTATANSTVVIPAGFAIDNIYFVNTTANAVTGGIKIGTTAGGTEVVDTIAIGANAIVDTFQSLDWALKQRLFSTTLDTTLYFQAVTSWNSASVNIAIQRTKVF